MNLTLSGSEKSPDNFPSSVCSVTYLADSLLGEITVTPASVRPGQPLTVQVNDPSGHQYKDNSDVRISIQGIGATSRVYQFATTGTRKLKVQAEKGDVREIKEITVKVEGEPLKYRLGLDPSAPTAMPILQATLKLGNPYVATFSLGTPASILPLIAKQLADSSHDAPRNQAPAARPAEPSSETNLSKKISSIPESQIKQLPARKVTNSDGTKAISSAAIGTVKGPAIAVKAEPTSYKWDFGDGTSSTTNLPTVTHDFFPAIKSGKISHSFNVTCTVVHDNLMVNRTLVLVSPYGISKGLGTIVPHHTGDQFATFQHVGFSGSMIVHNIEDHPIMLDQMGVVPISDDRATDPPPPKFTRMKTPITIPAHQAVGVGVNVSREQLGTLGPKTNGFTVFYQGNTVETQLPTVTTPVVATNVARPAVPRGGSRSTKVCFSHTFRIRLTDSGMIHSMSSTPWNHAEMIKAVASVASNLHGGNIGPVHQTIDTSTSTVVIPLASNKVNLKTQEQVRASTQAGLASVASRSGVITHRGVLSRSMIDPVKAGEECYPDNISDADALAANTAGLACQLTNETQTRLIPGAFQNALKGDIILSPGEDGADNLIGALLRSLNPPQYHSHSGLMTQNYYEITHCTASPERLTASGNLTGIGGAGGIKPDILQYAWPGSITQTVDNAITGERWNDPLDPSGNTNYKIAGFNPEPLGIQNSSNEFVLVYPMVVKPLPENEATARPVLRKAAELARSKGARVDANGNLTQKGGAYYCFYCYTKPEVSAKFADPAAAGAGWAQGLSPAVCSSFIWMCMKTVGVNCVGPRTIETVSELTPVALSQGAAVGATTLDGLFYYSQAERQKAAQVLNSIIYNQALQHEGFAQYIPILGPDIAQNIADQILNMFASNDPNKYGSSDWQNSGDANAVSPDNITWWNPPYFGYAEQLQYLQQHTEQYTVSRWQKTTSSGTISGRVTWNGSPVSGAHVSLNDMLISTTGSDGHFHIDKVPTGSYDLKAWAVETMNGIGIQVANGPSGPAGPGEKITTTPANPNLTKDIVLRILPENFRKLDLQVDWSADHGDANPWHRHGWDTQGPNTFSIPLGPGIDGHGTTNSLPVTYDYGGGGFFKCRYDFTAALLEDLSIQVSLTGRMLDDGNNSELTEYTVNFNVPINRQSTFTVNLENDGFSYHNGPAKFIGTATNNRETS